MASHPGEKPEFISSLELTDALPHFDPARIATEAIWPALDDAWRGNWREAASPGFSFVLPNRGVVDGVTYDVYLGAGAGLTQREYDDEPRLCADVRLTLEELVTGSTRRLILGTAFNCAPKTMSVYPDGKGLSAKKGVTYSFYTDDPAEIDAYQALENVSGMEIWDTEEYRYDPGERPEEDSPLKEDEDGQLDPDKFLAEDLDHIATALLIIGAPAKCLEALDIIRTEPLE